MINPEQNRLRKPQPGAPPPPGAPPANDVVPTPGARPGRQLNPRQQARQDALAALTPQQVANRARRQAGRAPAPTPGGTPPGAPGPRTQVPPSGGSSPFVPMGGGGDSAMGGAPGVNTTGWPGQPPPASMGGGQSPQQQYNPLTDPWNLWKQAVPLMDLNRDKQIGSAMATAGFDGNRFGTWAGGKAAEIGAENSLAQDQLLGQLLSGFANNQEDRALQSANLGLNSAALQEQMTRNRIMDPFNMGQYEQGRQDSFSRQAYDDFNQNRLGWLGPALQAANGQGAGSPGQIYTTQSPGNPGVAGYAPLLQALLGAFGGR